MADTAVTSAVPLPETHANGDHHTSPDISTSEANATVAKVKADTSSLMNTSEPNNFDSIEQEPTSGGATTTAETSGTTVVAPDAGAGKATPSSSKKDKKKSRTVPEHKKQKKNRKKSQVLQLDAQPGEHYWARLKGYPPWPSVICDEEMLPESLLLNRPVTTKRPDGTYRADYADGGKNVRDRTYPVMYLVTNEFSWTPNTDLTPLHQEDLPDSKIPSERKNKALHQAWLLARKEKDIQYYKDELGTFAQEVEANEALLLKKEEERRLKKEQQEKRKSLPKTPKAKVKKAEDDNTVDLDTPEDAEKPKSSKKRKAEGEGREKPAKTPKTSGVKINLKQKSTPGTTGKSKTKKSEPAAENEPAMTEAERKEKLQKEILFFRHKLQKTFLARDNPPSEEEMSQANDFMSKLERYTSLDDAVIRNTKIHKVLRGIISAKFTIPMDEELGFRRRCKDTLEKWGMPFDAPKTPAGVGASEEKSKPVTDDAEKDAAEKKAEVKDVEAGSAELEKKEDAEGDTMMEDVSKPVDTEVKTNGVSSPIDAYNHEAPKVADTPAETDGVAAES